MKTTSKNDDWFLIKKLVDSASIDDEDKRLLKAILDETTSSESFFSLACALLRTNTKLTNKFFTLDIQSKLRLIKSLAWLIEIGFTPPTLFFNCLRKNFTLFPSEVKPKVWNLVKHHRKLSSLKSITTPPTSGVEAMIPRKLPIDSTVMIHVKFLPHAVLRSRMEQDELQVVTEPMYLPPNDRKPLFLEVHTTAGEVDPPYLTVELGQRPLFISFQLKPRQSGSHLFVLTVRLTSTGQPVAVFTTWLTVAQPSIVSKEKDETAQLPTIIPFIMESRVKNDIISPVLHDLVETRSVATISRLLRKIFLNH